MGDATLRFVQLAADAAHQMATAYMHYRAGQAGSSVAPQRVTVLEVKRADEGCPYCTVAKHLASAHLYLSRMRTHKAYLPIYTELARHILDDALLSLYRLEQTPATRDLAQQVENVGSKLHFTLSDDQLEMLVRLLWTLANSSLNLAESTRGS